MRAHVKIPVSPIDENHLLYGNFIGVQYVFDNSLDEETLTKSVSLLIERFPALSGKYSPKTSDVWASSPNPTLKIKRSSERLLDVDDTAKHRKFLWQPKRKDVLKGRAPLSTFTLTTLIDGGAILGVAISHLLTDAAGFHMLMKHLGDIYTALKSGVVPPNFPFLSELSIFNFGTSRSKTEVLNELKRRQLPKPMPIKGMIGMTIRSLIIRAMDKSISNNIPVKIHFTADDVKRLKDVVLSESGENWISTNTALCAHFTTLIAKLSYGEDIKTDMQIGQLFDLRNRYFETDKKFQNDFIGNAIFIHIESASFPKGLQKTSRGDVARYYKKRQSEIEASDIHDRLVLLSDCIRHGYTNPELDIKNPIISLNNQSKMPVYDVRFSRQKPLQIYPQDVGDNIMFFPGADGGLDIYIRDIVNPLRQQELLTSAWQRAIFDFR